MAIAPGTASVCSGRFVRAACHEPYCPSSVIAVPTAAARSAANRATKIWRAMNRHANTHDSNATTSASARCVQTTTATNIPAAFMVCFKLVIPVFILAVQLLHLFFTGILLAFCKSVFKAAHICGISATWLLFASIGRRAADAVRDDVPRTVLQVFELALPLKLRAFPDFAMPGLRERVEQTGGSRVIRFNASSRAGPGIGRSSQTSASPPPPLPVPPPLPSAVPNNSRHRTYA
ncbi:hypothetical protein C7408_102112 [Paraburkholderia caballeronis]|nr:hypothetical protein C7408_102112 [Paraburkholderia caballeronis]TDV21969.1 hypothetical protein C7406_101112 [Paraburkholderia caballeronis]TDV28872.1 hypothetical protein C7404_102112 [Paraburkholderia caballeronis]